LENKVHDPDYILFESLSNLNTDTVDEQYLDRLETIAEVDRIIELTNSLIIAAQTHDLISVRSLLPEIALENNELALSELSHYFVMETD
jgi:hypothetical protein